MSAPDVEYPLGENPPGMGRFEPYGVPGRSSVAATEVECLRVDNAELRETVAALGCIVQAAEHDRDVARGEAAELRSLNGRLRSLNAILQSDRDSWRAKAGQ